MEMSAGTNDDRDAWKIFNRDTEAGRLLSRLYGVPPSGGGVTYPQKRRRRGSDDDDDDADNDSEEAGGDALGKAGPPPSRSWKTTYTVRGWSSRAAEEEKERERKENIARALSLAVPRVGRGNGERGHGSANGGSAVPNGKVNGIPRRKTEVTCRSTIQETKEKARHYRPPHSRTNAELEKRRLQGGSEGRCLPEDLTSIPPGPNGANEGEKKTSIANMEASRPSTLFDQIHLEILERRRHQMAMEEAGAGEATRESTAREIKERLERLKRLDSQRALSVVRKLMKS